MKKLSNSKGLRVAVAGVALVAAGSLAIPLAGAAKGGGKTQTGSTTVLTNYSIKASDAKYGGSSSMAVVDKTTGATLSSLPEEMAIVGTCSANGTNVGWFGTQLSAPTIQVSFTNPSLSGGASCNVDLQVRRNFQWVTTASASFLVTP